MDANKKYHDRFFPQYTLLVALNLNYTNKANEAIGVLEVFDFKKYKDQLVYTLDLQLIHAVFYFQQHQYKNALQLLLNFNHSDQWYIAKAGIIWVIKKNLIEILLRIELDQLEVVESRIRSFRKKHGAYLKENKETRTLDFLKLADLYYSKPNSEEFKKQFQKLMQNPKKDKNNINDKEDIFEMSFYAWIKSKIDNTSLYESTLMLLK